MPAARLKHQRGGDWLWLSHGQSRVHSALPSALQLRGDRITELLRGDKFTELTHDVSVTLDTATPFALALPIVAGSP